MEIAVLRWGHRPLRDARLTTHVALTARALGATQFFLADVVDKKIENSVTEIVKNWGGPFSFTMGEAWKQVVKAWRNNDGVVVHLTAYGENVEESDVMKRIKARGKNVLILVGSQKVPQEFFMENISDFNVAIGSQPHSECASLAVFLDRFFEGREFRRTFDQAKRKIIPQKRGKKTLVVSL
jgi:tRNA (cytidine56-2'-O)-methyltransferase